MNPIARYVTYLALGLIGGALATAAAGIGYVITDNQLAYRRTLTQRARAIHFAK